MHFIHEYWLVVVVAVPVLTIAVLNALLFAYGDEELLLPVPRPFPAIDMPTSNETPESISATPIGAPANDAVERESA